MGESVNLFRKFIVASGFSACLLLSGCAGVQSPVGNGFIFTSIKGPLSATSNPTTAGDKIGTSKAYNILGLVALGDATVDTAKKSAGITKVVSVDYDSFSVLALFSSFTTIVHGDSESPQPGK